MPAAKTSLTKGARRSNKNPSSDPAVDRVLTLSETAAYLRIPENSIFKLVREQGLPGRQIGREWRFLRSAVDEWLRTPINKSSKEALLAMAGSWKDDPQLDELLAQIYEQRGRPMLESDE